LDDVAHRHSVDDFDATPKSLCGDLRDLGSGAVELSLVPTTVASVVGHEAGGEVSIEVVVGRLDDEVARRLLVSSAEAHEDVMRAVRLAAADESERLAVLKAAVDDGLRTRRHLDYWGSSSWARDAASVVDALAGEVAAEPSAELVVLLQRAAGHLVKVILRADDSDGMIGDLARRVLDLHCQACAADVADPQALAKWMVRFAFDDQDFFEIDPVAYADALGAKGLAVYRREVAKRSEPVDEPYDRSPVLRDMYGGFPSFAATYAAERLAVIDRDVDRLIELLGGDLSSPHQFTRVAEAMIELGQPATRWRGRAGASPRRPDGRWRSSTTSPPTCSQMMATSMAWSSFAASTTRDHPVPPPTRCCRSQHGPTTPGTPR
jgi:hypothetical protein